MATKEEFRSERFSFDHATLGPVVGITRTPSVVQFRSIAYARIPMRFRQSIAVDVLESHERDCTEFGPSCPQIPQPTDAVGGPLADENNVFYDEQRCLNLTVTAPLGVLDGAPDKAGLPVMVHVHGGAFKEGSYMSSVRDPYRIVEQSISDGSPVVVIGINYRVNWLGFLACQDLLDDAAATKTQPFNFGLHDQRNAFFWVHKHIRGFGGNKNDITAFGESAGSVSLSFHICSSTEPLFKRVVLQSGTPVTVCPEKKLAVKEEQYYQLLEYCGIDPDAIDRLQKLRETPVETLVRAVQDLRVVSFSPFVEKGLFPIAPSYFTQVELFERCTWLTEAIIGDSLYEGFMFSEFLKPIEFDHILLHFERNVGQDNATRILEAYGIQRGMDKNLFWTRLSTLAGDLTFSQPIHALVRSLAANQQQRSNKLSPSKKFYRYNLTLRNPFPGSPLYSIAGHHFIEILFQFMTLRERYPIPRLQDISTDFARRLIRFANGEAPWSQYEADKQHIAVVSSRDGWQVYTREEDVRQGEINEEGGRRYEAWEVVEKVLAGLGEDREDIVSAIGVQGLLGLAIPPGAENKVKEDL